MEQYDVTAVSVREKWSRRRCLPLAQGHPRGSGDARAQRARPPPSSELRRLAGMGSSDTHPTGRPRRAFFFPERDVAPLAAERRPAGPPIRAGVSPSMRRCDHGRSPQLTERCRWPRAITTETPPSLLRSPRVRHATGSAEHRRSRADQTIVTPRSGRTAWTESSSWWPRPRPARASDPHTALLHRERKRHAVAQHHTGGSAPREGTPARLRPQASDFDGETIDVNHASPRGGRSGLESSAITSPGALKSAQVLCVVRVGGDSSMWPRARRKSSPVGMPWCLARGSEAQRDQRAATAAPPRTA